MSNHKRFWIPILLLAVFAVLRCGHPPILQSPPTLVGSHTGIYSRAVEGTDSSVTEPIIWIFTETRFSFSCDFEHYPTKDATQTCFAACSGYYSIGGGIVLSSQDSSTLDSNVSPRTCAGPYAPYGSYVLDQSSTSVIIMTSVTQNPQGKSVTRIITLLK